MATKRGLSIENAIRGLFPRGYVDQRHYERMLDPQRVSSQRKGTTFNLTEPPCSAVDLFAVGGLLLLRSGAYHHVVTGIPEVPLPRLIQVSESDRKNWTEVGKQWRGDGEGELPKPPPDLRVAWKCLMAAKHEPLFQYTEGPRSEPPAWWKAALALFSISDEASRNIGFATGRLKSAQAAYIEIRMRKKIKAGEKVYTISWADPDQICVLPKSRTPRVGCTLRSLSHHLALLPPRGLARSYWTPAWTINEREVTGAETAFNMLVVPIPYVVRASAFSGIMSEDKYWGWFSVSPHWCPKDNEEKDFEKGIETFISFVKELISDATKDVGAVHAVVFPELALSYKVFRMLCVRLNRETKCELVISGLFDAPSGIGDEIREGNFAAMARFGEAVSGQRDFSVSTREKHHRWRLDRSQIEAYALGASLNANQGWWERIDIFSRSLDVFVLRGNATVTTLICEDLARNDPCQELVRAIGPNLVVALLMDGAQLKDRWPARYATVLADDPGSSVLTLTCLGLIRRSNETGWFPAAQQIGLWRDDTGRVMELKLPTGAQALCLSLRPTQLTERTLDGRGDQGDAQSWRLTGVTPVSADRPKYGEILRGLWPRD